MNFYKMGTGYTNLDHIVSMYFWQTNINQSSAPSPDDFLVVNIIMSNGTKRELAYEEAVKFRQFIEEKSGMNVYVQTTYEDYT